MKKTECPNCGRKFDTPYCPLCGQRRGTSELTWQTLWDGLLSTLVGEGFGGERGCVPRYGVIRTLWCICIHPVRTIRDFLTGKTRRYFNPIALLLLLSAACAFTAHSLHVDLVSDQTVSKGIGNPIAEFAQWLFTRINDNPAFSILLTAPLTALNYKWIFRRFSKLGYVEYLYVEIIVGCINMTLSLFQVVLYATTNIRTDSEADSLLTGIAYGAILAVSVCVYRSLLRIGWVRAAISTLLATACSYAMMLIILSVLGLLMLSLLR